MFVSLSVVHADNNYSLSVNDGWTAELTGSTGDGVEADGGGGDLPKVGDITLVPGGSVGVGGHHH